jgi:hypothetical protein
MNPGDLGIVNDKFVVGDVVLRDKPEGELSSWSRVGRMCLIIATMKDYVCILDGRGGFGWIYKLMISDAPDDIKTIRIHR